MLDFYWVGNSGNWTDSTNHWSYTSGGPPIGVAYSGPGYVTDVDGEANVHFDANSFTLDGQTITFDDTVYMHDMDWTGCLHSPKLVSTTERIWIEGSLTLIPSLDISGVDTSGGPTTVEWLFVPYLVGGTYTVDFAGLSSNAFVVIDAYQGNTYNLVSDITVNDIGAGYGIYFYSSDDTGIINTNGYTLTTTDLYINGYNTDSGLTGFIVNLGNSTINIISGVVESSIYIGNETDGDSYTLNAGTSTIHLFSGELVCQFHEKVLYKLEIDSGANVSFFPETSFSLRYFEAVGTLENPIIIDSTDATPLKAFHISKVSGRVIGYYLNLSYCHAIGGASWYACHSTDNGGNEGWSFTCPTYYSLAGEPMDTGVYTLGRHSTSYPIVLDLTYPISERDGTDLVLDGVEIGSILIDDDDVYVSWKRTTDGIETFGIDKIDSDNKLSGAYFETRVLSGNREQLGNFSKFIISYGELPTGTDIIVSYSRNYGTDWNTMTTKKDIDRKLLYCEEEFEASSVAYRAVITATGNDAPAIERADIIMR